MKFFGALASLAASAPTPSKQELEVRQNTVTSTIYSAVLTVKNTVTTNAAAIGMSIFSPYLALQ
jgi:hypothetical protein